MQYDLTAIGELLIDFVPNGCADNGVQQFGANPGGAPANVCAISAKLGDHVAFIGKVGTDPFGVLLRNTLQKNHISTEGLIMDPTTLTTLTFVTLDECGERDFCFYRKNSADTMLRPDELNWNILSNSKFLHFGSLSLTNEPSRSATFEAVTYAKTAGCIISYDPNYRPALWGNAHIAIDMMLRGVVLADILKVSEEEAVLLSGSEDIAQSAQILADMGPSVIIITCGSRGAYYHTNGGTGMVPGFNVEVIDTTGAGDTFIGSFLHYVKKKTLEEINTLKNKEMEEIVQKCNAAAAITTTGLGAIASMPTVEQLHYFLTEKITQ